MQMRFAVLMALFMIPAATLAAAAVSAGTITVDRPWTPATPNGAATAAAYLTIDNHGRTDDRLVSASSPVGARVELHRMSMTGGIMTMRPVPDGLDVPADKSIVLQPQANYHLMITGLKSPLKSGTEFPLTLTFAKAGAVRIDVPVLPIGSRGPDAAMPEHMDHH